MKICCILQKIEFIYNSNSTITINIENDSFIKKVLLKTIFSFSIDRLKRQFIQSDIKIYTILKEQMK